MITPDSLFAIDQQPLGEFIPDMLLMKISEGIAKQSDVTKLEFSSTYIHEYTHWLQFAGTNWGCMQLILGQSATNSLVNEATFGNISECITGLKNISVTKEFQVIGPEKFYRSKMLFQNWQDGFITKKLFGIGRSELFQIPFCPQSIAVGLCDYTNTINYLLNAGEINLSELEPLFLFTDIKHLKSVKYGEVTVYDLIEGQAKINDVLHKISLAVGTSDEFDIDFISFFENRYPEVYSKAFKVYLEYSESGLAFGSITNLYSLVEECIKFCIIVDISLAIEAPPFKSKEKYCTTKWGNIFPPIRFGQLIKASGKIIFDFENTVDETKYHDFVRKLCDETGYLHPADQASFFLDSNDVEIRKIERRFSLKDFKLENINGLMDYFLYLFIKFNKLRLKNPGIICLPGLNGVDVKLAEMQWIKDNYWLHCPFQMNGDIFGNTIPNLASGLSGSLLGLLVSNRICEQHLIRNVTMKDLQVPFAINDALRNIVVEIQEKQFGIKLQWQ